MVNDAKKEKAVKDIATILDGFTANEINEVPFAMLIMFLIKKTQKDL